MNLSWKKIAVGGGILILILILILIFLLRGSGGPSTSSSNGSFGSNPGTTGVSVGQSGGGASSLPSSSSGISPTQKVFEIAVGPVVGAELTEAGEPTTTVARYITSQDGHILQLELNTPGAVPQILSNTTIPGIEEAYWSDGGSGVIVQYLDQGTMKSAHLLLPGAASTSPTSINFLPDNILALAVSPNGSSVVYLLRSATGASGYLSQTNGSNIKELFSLPLSQLILSWPSPGTILAYSKAAAGVAGIAFSINAKTGSVAPVLYGLGLTVSGNPDFSYLLYRTDTGSAATLYTESTISGGSSLFPTLSTLETPFPEECVWGSSNNVYCAAPAEATPYDYLDLWHRSEASVPDSLVLLNIASSTEALVATPGTSDGGETADMTKFSLSPDGQYLSFISKDDEALWGVRLQ
ncbi:MAG: hypothetical protein KGJ34_01030 [Patescibacteria group bacterium]|nr:hypothetical protein [Patescibacteria group bacterium]